MAEQMKDGAKELKRDIEKALTGSQGSVLSGTRQLAGAEAWIATNASHSAGGSTTGFNPSTNTVAGVTDGTAKREFTESLLNDAFQNIYAVGGKSDTVMLGGSLKRKLSTFNGGTTVNTNATAKEIVNTVDAYTGDFGRYVVKTNFIMRTSTVLLLDTDTWAVSWLEKYTKTDLPQTGLYTSKMLHAELTLEARNERGNGKIADVQPTA